jgi:cytochrome c biogenesis protein CcmG/thiol:disulfide interchange protein DsbE
VAAHAARSGRRKLLLLGVVVLLAAGGLSGWLISSGLASTGETALSPGDPAPAFSLPPLEAGRPRVSLSGFRGRPVVLNFFASWCPPCRTELPAFQAASRRYGGRVQFVGVDVGDTSAAARQLVGDTGVTYPVGVDPDYRVAGGRYQLLGMPTTVFVNADGTVAGSVTGQVGQPRLEAWLGRLLRGS